MQHQQQQSMSPARVVFYSGAAVPSPMSPVVAHLYTLIKTLSEAPQDDVKYRALKEISERLEDLVGTPAYASLVDSLIRVFIKLLQETSPQFITENNTLQLRKLMLDLLLRLSANEMMKNYVKILQQILLRLIYMENEENALIIVKILTDHIKTFRPPFTPDLNTFFAQSKSAFNGMFAHAANEAMFLKRPFITTNKTIEESVAEALKTCYSSATLSYSQQHQYTLVPRASQSVKVLAEMSAFLFVLIQAHRQNLIREVVELIPIFVRYVNIAVPHRIREHKLYNRELVEEFHSSQVRALSFVAYTSRQVQMAPIISDNAKALSDGIINLFDGFHGEVVGQRRDLLVAIKYFFQCEARAHFIGIIPTMCDDNALLGRSFTSQDQLRNQAYSFLADILHHVRMNLDQKLLMHIFFIASRNLHDAQLLPYVQTMYGKLMMNLIESVMVQPKEHSKMFREVLCASLDSFVRKAKFVAEFHLPLIVEKHRSHHADAKQQQQQQQQGQQQQQQPGPSSATEKCSDRSDTTKAFEACQAFWQDSCQPLALNDCKNMVRFTIQPVKMMVIALKNLGEFDQSGQMFCPRVESDSLHRVVDLLSDFFRYGLKCLDIFIVAANVMSYPKLGATSVRSKEEKDTIEAFVSTYTQLDAPVFEKIIEQHIEFLISRILDNPALQHVCNSFFMHQPTMTCMGNVLVKFLLSKLSELGGVSNEKAALHLKLFKLVFQAVSFAQNSAESENLLKPFLHRIVQESMRLAVASRESTNYFLLLRALFRSIGSGTHDLLYQQFLPLLPSILQQLNRLQNGAHRQAVHELFVELCLTIPVRLSSLLPYLPLLMDPLVCALNGSPSLVQQGLRTLELCVDNLQPEYLYEHMMPVRGALMSGLWRTVYASDAQSALSALRILGKFGGSNRKALLDPQTWNCRLPAEAAFTNSPKLAIEWTPQRRRADQPFPEAGDVHATMMDVAEDDAQRHFGCKLPLRGAVQSAVSILRSQPITDAAQIGTPMGGTSPPSNSNLPIKIQAVELIRNVLLLGIKSAENPTLIRRALSDAMKIVQTVPSFADDDRPNVDAMSAFCCADKFSRDIFVEALTGLFIAVFNTETRTQILPFFKMFTKHLTVMAVLESNPANFHPTPAQQYHCLDSSILIDTIVVTLGDSCKDYCHTAIVALRLMFDTAASLFNGDREKACQLPLFTYIINKVTALCYRHEWFAHHGGCTAMRMIVEQYPRTFVQRHSNAIFDACLATISGLSDELSCGVIESASRVVDLLLEVCFSAAPTAAVDGGGNGVGKCLDAQQLLLSAFVTRLVDLFDHSEQILRKECLRIFQLLAEKTKLPAAQLIAHYSGGDLHRTIRYKMHKFASSSVDTKIALIDFFLFFANIDEFPVEFSLKELEILAQNLLFICCSSVPIQPKFVGIPTTTNANSNAAGGVPTTDVNLAPIEAADEQKVQLIKTTAIDALVTLYMKTVSKTFVSPRDEGEMFESESGDIDLRGPQYLMDIFEFLIRCLLNEDNEHLREAANRGLTKIVTERPKPEHSGYIAMKLEQFVEQFRNKKQFISKRFFEKLLFFTAHSTTNISPMELQMIGNDLSLIMQTSASSLKVDDIECVAKALELFHALSHKKSALLREAFVFFANCFFNFSTELQNKWIHSVLPFMNAHSVDFADVFLAKEFLIGQNSYRFLMELIGVSSGAFLLRNSLLKNLNLIKPFISEINTSPNVGAPSFELHLLNFLSVLLDHNEEWDFEDQNESINELFGTIRSLWCSNSFKRRHSVRNYLLSSTDYSALGDDQPSSSKSVVLDVPTMDCPALCARILLAKLRSVLNSIRKKEGDGGIGEQGQDGWDSPLVRESIDLIYDLITAFDHCYASDFTFLRKFIDDEIIAKSSLPWRRATFTKLIDLLKNEPSAGRSVQLVRFVQYIVSPVFAYAFEMNDVDTVVCAEPSNLHQLDGNIEQQQQQQQRQFSAYDGNIVLLLCHEVIHRLANERSMMSDSLNIVMYLFCSLVVQKCPLHIYDPAKRQHGNRQEQGNLRHFMLFAWPCLQQSFQGDVTEKYAGHFLIANIIDKFSIIKTIILQVLSSLMQSYHHDNRDLVRKSLEILIPALPRRMPDGYFRLQTLFKKIMVEEGRNNAQVVHCLQIIIRHHKVFYNIRHQIAPHILSALHRLFSLQLNFETRRLMLEVCEVVIKWEQDRQTAVEDNNNSNKSAALVNTTTTTMGDDSEGEAAGSQQSEEIILESSSSTQQQQQSTAGDMTTDVHKPMDKHFIDSIVTFIFRIATFVDQYSGQSSTSSTSSMEHINRRAVILLRSALKPTVFGDVATLRTTIIEKQLQLPNTEQFGTGNEQAISHQLSQVQVTLDVLTNITHHLMPKMIIDIFRPLQRALVTCISYINSQQILRSTYNVLSKLLEKTKCSPSGLDELDMLNHHVIRVIQDSFGNYAVSANASPPMTTITLLRLMHSAQPSYLETVCLMPFVKLLQRLVREYVVCNPGTVGAVDQAQKLISDLLAICLEMLCTRTKFFSMESQRTIIQIVLIPLIEKGAVDKIVENIIKVLQEIVASEIASSQQQQQQQQQQSLATTTTLIDYQQPSQGVLVLIKLFSAMEQRLFANAELQRHFMNATINVYEHEQLLGIKLDKLEPAFHWGLASADRELRNKFFVVFEKRFPKDTAQRLLYIIMDVNWHLMDRYDWVAHVVHLLLLSEQHADQRRVELKQCATLNNTLEQIVGTVNMLDKAPHKIDEDGQQLVVDEAVQDGNSSEKKQRMADEGCLQQQNEDADVTLLEGGIQTKIASLRLCAISADGMPTPTASVGSGEELLLLEAKSFTDQQQPKTTMIDMQIGLLSLANELTTVQLISSLVDILHADTALCRKTFVELFCSLWSTFAQNEREQVELVVGPFLSSAVHLCQRDSPRAVVTSFLEAFVLCSPPIKLEPFMLCYLGSTFNCWHVALAQLERLAMNIRFSIADPVLMNTTEPASEKLEVLECLAKLYQQLNELDQYSALWKRRAYFDKTAKCLALFQQGEFGRAREMAEKLVAQLGERLSKTLSSDAIGALSTALQAEQRAWEQCWISSCKQLNDWTSLEHFAKSDDSSDVALAMESAWHLHDWNRLKDRVAKVDAIANPQTVVRSSMFQLMLNVTNFRLNKESMERQLIDLYRTMIAEWRRLPPIVSHGHMDILNNSHLLHEISESANLLYTNIPLLANWSSNSNTGTINNNHMLNNAIKHMMKTWRNRPLTTVDQNSVWLDLFNWRLQFFSSLLRFYDNSEQQQQQQQLLAAAASSPPASTTLSVPLHAITQCHLQQARAFRRSNQLDMAQIELNKLNPAALLVHPMDAQQKLDEHVKCLLKLASGDVSSTAKKVKAQDAILEALETIEGTPFNCLKRDQIARLMTNKGILLSRMDKREEAGRAFSAAAQLEQLGETAIPSSFASVWKHWATFLGNLYLTNHTESSALNTGIQAIACTLEHIWMVGAQKSRTSVAKLFWLLKIASSCPSEKLMNSVDEKLLRYVDTIHPTNWLFWLHEIVADVQQRKGTAMAEILKRVGLMYPQEVFCALRVELGPARVGRLIEQYTEQRQLLSLLSSDVAAPSTVAVVVDVDDGGGEDGTKRQRLFGVLDAILRRHLTQICALNQMMDELDNFSIGPAEATLNKFRQILSDCHFDQFTKIGELSTTPTDAQLLKGLIEWLQSPQIVQAAAEGDTIEGKLFNELLGDFDFCTTAFSPQQNAAASGVPLHRVASSLRKWVCRICAHLRSTLGKSAKRLADSSTFLAQFNAKMAQINIFDGHLNMGTSPQFNTQIAQFVPHFDEIVRADSVFRLFRVRALNGKIYSYQLERVRYDHSRGHIFQLFCLLNAEFAKRRDTARRFVQFALPHILYIGANCRLLRCCPLAGLSSRHQNANADHSAQNFAVFTDIMSEMLNNGDGTDCAVGENGTLSLSPLAVIDQYYGRLAEQRYSHKTIHELFNQICGMKSEAGTGGGDQHHHLSSASSLITVQKDLLSRWMGQKYGDAATIWMARKKLAVQIALLGLSEHALFLSSMRPDGLFLDLSTGQLFFTDYKFDLTKKVCETITGKVPFIELDANRPVPFRLTPNISHFLGLSIDGQLIGALTAVARSLNALSLEVWLRPILWDVFAKAAEDDPQLNIVNPVKRAVDTIVGRVKTLSQFDVGMGTSSQQQLLVQHSMLYDNLCRMDPSWHPWF